MIRIILPVTSFLLWCRSYPKLFNYHFCCWMFSECTVRVASHLLIYFVQVDIHQETFPHYFGGNEQCAAIPIGKSNFGWPAENEDRFPVPLIVAWRKTFQQVWLVLKAAPAEMSFSKQPLKVHKLCPCFHLVILCWLPLLDRGFLQ